MNVGRLKMKMAQLLSGHLFNPFWHNRFERRIRRGQVVTDSVSRYLDRYSKAFSDIIVSTAVQEVQETGRMDTGRERVFSIWLQGEENAPEVVRSCLDSIRKNSGLPLTVLNASSVTEMTSLPEYVIDKWKSGKMRPAHFTDLCRLDLLYRYGGVWMDATDFVVRSLPEEVMKEPFFVYMAEDEHGSYFFIQNCFIRAVKGNPLVRSWLEAALEYWKHEDSVADYFIHQLIFKKLVECNTQVAELFEKMPQVHQDPIHKLWFANGTAPYDRETFLRLTDSAAFQKTEYRSEMAKNPPPGSNAEALVKRLYQ